MCKTSQFNSYDCGALLIRKISISDQLNQEKMYNYILKYYYNMTGLYTYNECFKTYSKYSSNKSYILIN